MRLVASGNRETEEQGEVACLKVELPKVDRSVFEKSKFKNFKKGVDSRVGTARGGWIRRVSSEGWADRVDEQK